MLHRLTVQLARSRALNHRNVTRLSTCSSYQVTGSRPPHSRSARRFSLNYRRYSESGKSLVDVKMEEIQDLYAAAKDEFEFAAEETEGNTVYAEADRVAAREALTKLQNAYKAAVDDADKQFGEEVTKRVGPRIRELENAVTAMEDMAQNHD